MTRFAIVRRCAGVCAGWAAATWGLALSASLLGCSVAPESGATSLSGGSAGSPPGDTGEDGASTAQTPDDDGAEDSSGPLETSSDGTSGGDADGSDGPGPAGDSGESGEGSGTTGGMNTTPTTTSDGMDPGASGGDMIDGCTTLASESVDSFPRIDALPSGGMPVGGACGGDTGGTVYEYTASSAGTYRFALVPINGSVFTTVLTVVDAASCTVLTCAAGNGATFGTSASTAPERGSEVEVSVPAGTRLLLVADRELEGGGLYGLYMQ